VIRKYICPICKKPYTELNSTISHIDNTHEDLTEVLKEKDITIKQYLFNIRNKKDCFTKFGKSIITGKPTTFNESVGKYNRINPYEKALYREYRNKNMMKVRGTINMLTDPEHQKTMLANRSISGRYNYKGKEFVYSSSYEKDFLEYLDKVLEWDVNDIEMPANTVLYFKDPETNKDRFYIPDAFLISLNLLIEIKPGLDKQFHYRKRDLDIEERKDSAAIASKSHYFKVYDKSYVDFMLKVKELSENLES